MNADAASESSMPEADHSKDASSDVSAWVRWAARTGYVAKGAAYVLLSALAGYSAIDRQSAPSDLGGAMTRVQHVLLGPVLLLPLAVGLAAYATWRAVQGLFDPECTDDCDLASRWGPRLAFLCSSAFYGVLAANAAVHVFGARLGDHHGRSQAHWTAVVLHEWPLGRWLVAGVGVGIAVFCVIELWRAFSVRMSDRLGGGEYHWLLLVVGAIGIVSRALVFGVVGGLLIRAAWTAHAGHAQGLAAALRTLRHQPYGPWLLGVAALGLFTFGLFQFALARYRYIDGR